MSLNHDSGVCSSFQGPWRICYWLLIEFHEIYFKRVGGHWTGSLRRQVWSLRIFQESLVLVSEEVPGVLGKVLVVIEQYLEVFSHFKGSGGGFVGHHTFPGVCARC